MKQISILKIHANGMKYGIYEDFGNFTCGGYPGMLGHLETDANTLAEWGADVSHLIYQHQDII